MLPNKSSCETLTFENIKSDHIPVLLDLENGKTTTNQPITRYLINKTDWKL